MPLDELMEVARHQREIVWDAGLQDAAQTISDLMGVYAKLRAEIAKAEAGRDALRIALRELHYEMRLCRHPYPALTQRWADTLGQILTER
jgi:hypothetical protein